MRINQVMIVDTHSHIFLEEFSSDIKDVLQHSENEGINVILMPAIDEQSHAQLFDTEQAFPGRCLAMMGLHPCSVKENYEQELAKARAWLEKRRFVAVGEIGLDFYWDKTFTTQQYDAFHRQLDWALEYDIPVSIHSRNATDECISVVAEHQKGKLKGVFHCFSGTLEQAKQVIDLGFFLGIGGVVTFKNSGLDKVMQEVSLGHVVLETDAPYLAPVPFRGKRNEPSYLKYVVEKLAEIKKTDKQEVETITTENAKKLFKL